MHAKALTKKPTLTTLDLNDNNIGEIGYAAFLNLVYDKSSIEKDCSSNNTLREIDFECERESELIQTLYSDLESSPEINRKHKDNPKAARLVKIIKLHNTIHSDISAKKTKNEKLDSKVQHLTNVVA